MGTFTASLRAIGDVRALPATVELSNGRLSIAAGSTEIGSWALSDIHLEEIPTGYRLAAEGEQILIELKDHDGFAAELASRKKKARLGRKKASDADTAQRSESPEPVTVPPRPGIGTNQSPTRQVALPPREDTRPSRKLGSSGPSGKVLNFVDGTLAKARKRFGPYLPEWVFTRAMFAIACVALVLLVALPELVSTLLLIAGGVLIAFGAVVYSDPMLASRWLPGRTTPQHALLSGVGVLMVGVLLGIIAN
ncbi:MAG TPA: hypothetical protein VJ858_01985 [Acidimicrobiia bacterium]|nr:hypothetical protein [Acidimicrobiia bacterium]